MKSIIFVSMMAAVLPWQSVAAQSPQESSAITDQGKAIFTGRCAKCHDADGSKKLADGTTLLGRLAKTKDPEARLGTRLKDSAQRRQVFLYLKPLIEHEHLSGTSETAREKAEYKQADRSL